MSSKSSARSAATRAAGPSGSAEYFVVWNSNKRSVAVDLARTEGRQLLLDMLPNYDVFVENYGPGVMEKLRLDYAAMQAAKPDIIYARIKGFGTSGPWADYKCYDMVRSRRLAPSPSPATPTARRCAPARPPAMPAPACKRALAIAAGPISRR